VQRGGRGRRSSVLVPAAAARLAQAAVGSGLLGLAHHQALAAHQRARLAAQKRAHTVQAILQQLVAYFEEASWRQPLITNDQQLAFQTRSCS
jgi:hypothetical protein